MFCSMSAPSPPLPSQAAMESAIFFLFAGPYSLVSEPGPEGFRVMEDLCNSSLLHNCIACGAR